MLMSFLGTSITVCLNHHSPLLSPVQTTFTLYVFLIRGQRLKTDLQSHLRVASLSPVKKKIYLLPTELIKLINFLSLLKINTFEILNLQGLVKFAPLICISGEGKKT